MVFIFEKRWGNENDVKTWKYGDKNTSDYGCSHAQKRAVNSEKHNLRTILLRVQLAHSLPGPRSALPSTDR